MLSLLALVFELLRLFSVTVAATSDASSAACFSVHQQQQQQQQGESTSSVCTSAPTTTTRMADTVERTLLIVKPDGVQRGLVGEIIKRFEQKGFKLVAMKMVQASDELLSKHYADLSERPFYPGLVKYMASGPIIPMVWEGTGIVKTGRVMLGATDPAQSAPGTIRGDYCVIPGRNLIHGSDSVESAEKEVSLWFSDQEISSWTQVTDPWINTSN